MLYPKVYNIKVSKIIIHSLMTFSIILAFVLKLINVLTTPNFDWAFIAILGMVYAWCAVLYALRKHTNIAAHVLLHTILLIALVILLDHIIGYRGWSLSISLPIIIITANTIMFVLTIISRKRYIKYAFCHLVIFIISFMPFSLYMMGISHGLVLMIVASGIALATFIMTCIMCGRSLIEATEKTFHV